MVFKKKYVYNIVSLEMYNVLRFRTFLINITIPGRLNKGVIKIGSLFLKFQ